MDRITMNVIRKPADSLTEPVSLDEAKDYLRVTHEHEDKLIQGYIASAREACENAARISIVRKECVLILAPFGESIDSFGLLRTRHDPDAIATCAYLPWGPILSVDKVERRAFNYAVSAAPDGSWLFDPDFGRLLWPNPEVFAPAQTMEIRVSYTAGFNAVPAPIHEAVLETVASAYMNRGDLVSTLPLRAMQLLAPWRGRLGIAG